MLSKLKKTEPKVDLVTDLDDLISKSYAIKFKGKMHLIKPLSVQEYYSLAKALARLAQIENLEQIDATELVNAYYDLFSSVCETITLKDVEAMEQPQIAAFLATILDRFAPKESQDEKKNITPTA